MFANDFLSPSFLWIIVHIYVLTQIKNDGDLRMQRFADISYSKIWSEYICHLRYLDILMGLSMLVSLVSLEYGSMSGERAPLALFLILRYVWLLPPFFTLFSAWPPLLDTGSGSSTSSTSRWRARPQRRWISKCWEWDQSYLLFNHATVCTPSDTFNHAMTELILRRDFFAFFIEILIASKTRVFSARRRGCLGDWGLYCCRPPCSPFLQVLCSVILE